MADSNRGSPSKQLLAFDPMAEAGTQNEGSSPLTGAESRRRRVHYDPFTGYDEPAAPGVAESVPDMARYIPGTAQPLRSLVQSVSGPAWSFPGTLQSVLSTAAQPIPGVTQSAPEITQPVRSIDPSFSSFIEQSRPSFIDQSFPSFSQSPSGTSQSPATGQMSLATHPNSLGMSSEINPFAGAPVRRSSQPWNGQPGSWPQLSHAENNDRLRLPPFSSLGLQSANTHARNMIAATQWPTVWNNNSIDDQGPAQARYSPSQEVDSFNYDPTRNVTAPGHGYRPGAASQAHVHSVTMRQLANQDTSNALVRAPVVQALVPRPPEQDPDDTVRRAFIVDGIALPIAHADVIAMFPRDTFHSLEGVYIRQLDQTGRFSVVFGDLRDSENAFRTVRTTYPNWNVKYASIQELVAHGLAGPFTTRMSPENGRVVVLAYMELPDALMETENDDYVITTLQAMGDIRYLKVVSEDSASVHEYHVEYNSVQDAANACSTLETLLVGLVRFRAYPLDPPPQRDQHHGTPHRAAIEYNTSPNIRMEIDPTSPVSPLVNSRQPVDHVISIDKIRRGEDLRTTLMIRHIPNRVTSDELKRVLDRWCFGKFDFLYLRMDFMHDCNVGYAFVNFADPLDILRLVDNFQGAAWPGVTGSDKRVDLSYAAMQGKEALVAKFRNSTVMTRPHEQRPRLFYVDGHHIGREAPFPGPNDANQLRRSLVSTNQQGLYTPHRRSVGGSARNPDRRGMWSTPHAGRRGNTVSPQITRTMNAASPMTPRHVNSPQMYRTRSRQFSISRTAREEQDVDGIDPATALIVARGAGGNRQTNTGRGAQATQGVQTVRGSQGGRGSQNPRGNQTNQSGQATRRQNRMAARQAARNANAISPTQNDAGRRSNRNGTNTTSTEQTDTGRRSNRTGTNAGSPEQTDASRRFNWRDRR